ncbi:hypothetical protein K1X76_07305 [bacterium]|nr:hypothetical protein [bacterium]
MSQIVYLIGPNRYSTEGLHWCLHKAKEGSKALRVVYAGGDDEALLAEIDKQGATFAHKIEIQKLNANYLAACEQAAQFPDTVLLVLVALKKSFMGKLFGTDEFEVLKGKINCELKIY